MSHIDASLLAQYNSLMDPHLAAYFQNPKMRRQLRRNGLITRHGEIISENSYRQMMARKEHQRHVRELLAQAIVHKTLDMERNRQVAIRRKLEEISKIELVRRVKGDVNRKGDEDILPYLSPRRPTSRPSSVPAGKTGRRKPRPMSALVTREDGMPMTPGDDLSEDGHVGKGKKKRYPIEIDDKHLYALDSQALRDYKMTVTQSRGHSPYINSQLGPEMVPTPPSARVSGRRKIQHTDKFGRPIGRRKQASRLHRAEPVMRHPEQIQTLCSITLHYFGSHLKLDYERLDPRDEVVVEQQHCGGNTLTVFREKILPKSDFTFVSRRHRGYPFSLTIYIEGKVNCRLSTCCEYKHGKGSRLGGPQGHFGVVHIDGTTPCYKCQVNEQIKSKEEKKRQKEQAEMERKAKLAEEERAAAAAEEEYESDFSESEDKKTEDDETSRSPESTEVESARDTGRDTGRGIKGYTNSEDEQESTDGSSDAAAKPVEVPVDDEKEGNNKDKEEAGQVAEDIKEKDDGELEPLPWKTGTVPDEKEKESYTDDDFDDDQETETETERESRIDAKKVSKYKEMSPRSRSSSRSRSRSPNSPKGTQSDGMSSQKYANVVKTATIEPVVKNAVPSSDESSHSSRSSSSEGTTDRTTDRAIDSDRRKSPTPLQKDNANNANNTDSPDAESLKDSVKEITPRNESPPPLMQSPPRKESPPPVVEKEEHKSDSTEQENSEQDTLKATGQGGEDTLRALTDEMTKVLETANKEESLVEKSESEDSSSDSSSSSDSESESEMEVTPKAKTPSPHNRSVTTEPETSDNQAGGNDPDHVASDSSRSGPLTKIGVTPGPKHEGSIRPLIAGKRDVELTSLSLTDDQVRELSEVLDEAPEVESLILRNSGITDHGLRDINRGLQKATILKMINLNCNKLTDAEPITDLLLYPRTVEILLIHGNPLQDTGMKKLVGTLLSLHRSAATDEQMVEVRRKAKEVVADVMYDALHSSSLESIVTQGSSESTNGSVAKLLAESERLTANNLSGLTLKQLDIGDCQITSEGANSVAELIAHNLPIENLSLTGNKGVGIDGWDAIAEALKANHRMTTLSLDYNNLGDGGAQLIAEALAENRSIKNIDLEGNKIGEQGARKILEAIKARPNIQDVTLMPGNNIPASLLQEIKDTLADKR